MIQKIGRVEKKRKINKIKRDRWKSERHAMIKEEKSDNYVPKMRGVVGVGMGREKGKGVEGRMIKAPYTEARCHEK